MARLGTELGQGSENRASLFGSLSPNELGKTFGWAPRTQSASEKDVVAIAEAASGNGKV